MQSMQSMFHNKWEINKSHFINQMRKISRESLNVGMPNETLPNNPWIKEEMTEEIRQYFEMSENANTTY